MKDWIAREAAIKHVQDQELERLRQTLHEQTVRAVQRSQLRVASMRQQFEDDHRVHMEQAFWQKARLIRQLVEERRSAEEAGTHERDIIAEYGDFASRVYAPIAVRGERPQQAVLSESVIEEITGGHRQLDVLDTLERELDKAGHLSVTVRKPRDPRKSSQTIQRRATRELAQSLAHATTMVTEERQLFGETTKSAKTLTAAASTGDGSDQMTTLSKAARLEKYKKRVAVRPPTPLIRPSSTTSMEYSDAVVVLQSLLRGRAIQNILFTGRSQKLALIQELQLDVFADLAELFGH